MPTRQSLLIRLKDWKDEASWKVFFDTYWRLIYNAAVKAGLPDAEAQDVVQETVIYVLKKMPGFEYDATKGSFKNWLLRLTSWRIVDHLRKRQPEHARLERRANGDETSTGTDLIESVPDPASANLAASWDEDWDRNLMEAAIERVKKRVDPKQYQIFDLYVFKNWPVTRVSRMLRINPGRVYLAKHRINGLIRKEIAHLQARPI